MPLCVSRARMNEAVILEAFGQPVSAGLKWTCVYFPCISKTKRFQVDKYNIRFQTEEVQTKDGRRLNLNMEAKFKVNTNSEEGILQAYRKYKEDAGNTREGLEDEVLSLRSVVTNIATEVAMRQIFKMSFDEIIKFNWLLMDNIYVETNYRLKENSILLNSLQLLEITDAQNKTLVEEEIFVDIKREDFKSEIDVNHVLYDPDKESSSELHSTEFSALKNQEEEREKDHIPTDPEEDKTRTNSGTFLIPPIHVHVENEDASESLNQPVETFAREGQGQRVNDGVFASDENELERSFNVSFVDEANAGDDAASNTSRSEKSYVVRVKSSDSVKVLEFQEDPEFVIMDLDDTGNLIEK